MQYCLPVSRPCQVDNQFKTSQMSFTETSILFQSINIFLGNRNSVIRYLLEEKKKTYCGSLCQSVQATMVRKHWRKGTIHIMVASKQRKIVLWKYSLEYRDLK